MDMSVLRSITYGLYVLGTTDGSRPTGCVINTCMQITSADPVFAISVNQGNFTYEAICRSRRFSVSVLSERTDPSVITDFGFQSGRTAEKFAKHRYTTVDGLPVLQEEIAGALLFDVVSITDMGTHAVVFGRLRDTVAGSGTPMTYAYYHRVVKGSAPKAAPTYIEEVKQPMSETKKDEEQIWVCTICGYEYHGDLTKEPDDWTCPVCGAGKDSFELKK